ncbi:MAG TPA: hypothetical protein VF867_18820 [Arthrobacter sp.]
MTASLVRPVDLAYVRGLYDGIRASSVVRGHWEVVKFSDKVADRIQELINAGEPSGYLDSARRVILSAKLARKAARHADRVVDTCGDTSMELYQANEGLELLAAYAVECEAADTDLRAAIHDSLRLSA